MTTHLRQRGVEIEPRAVMLDESGLEVQCSCGTWCEFVPSHDGTWNDYLGEWEDDMPGRLECPTCRKGLSRWGLSPDAPTIQQFRDMKPGEHSGEWEP